MFQALRKQITPATVLAFVALVFALTGGAFAASSHGGSSPSKATASTGQGGTITATAAKAKAKTKAGPRGPAGPKGATGATGATGPAGTVGATGPAGPTGTAGTGSEGKEGKEGKVGGEGKEGKSGFTKTLPTGATETGEFAFAQDGPIEQGHSELRTAISFPIPLAATAVPHFIGQEEGEGEPKANLPSGCTGTSEKPVAEAGNLCIFAKFVQAATFESFEDGGTNSTSVTGLTGDTMFFEGEKVEPFPGGGLETPQAIGTWAVTAE